MPPWSSRWQQARVGPLGCPSLGTTTVTVSSPRMAPPVPPVLTTRIITVVATTPHRTQPWAPRRKSPQTPPSSMTKHLSGCRARGTGGGRRSTS
ncbi:proline rich mitotic checkpoint control factor [Rhinolophus ferrumequinum]|uniref:Proline rich mitotic checkpoint control factor n=1 Tax=Rhinolophus ferrumequinum TaxID=59479 RepID=A0A7J7SZJ7_RHIFE|nr:proline rich mitotic checkpoint control factor [Rhinolophus ferrumequinum]